MPNPSQALATLRPDLASSFMEWQEQSALQGFRAAQILPVLPVAKPQGTFGVIPVEQLLMNRDTLRAPGTNYSRSQFKFEKQTFICDEHGAEEMVDRNSAAMYSEYFDAEQVAAFRAYRAVLENFEKRVASLVFNTTTWTGASLFTDVAVIWATAATAVPITDVNAAKKRVFDNSGMWPNAVIMNRATFNNARNTVNVKDAIASAGAGDSVLQGRITERQLAQAFDVDFVVVCGSPKNTAAEGAAPVLSHIWADANVMVAKIAKGSDPAEPCIGRTFHWGEDGSQFGGTTESYYEEQTRSDIIRVRHQVEEKIIYPQCGHLLDVV